MKFWCLFHPRNSFPFQHQKVFYTYSTALPMNSFSVYRCVHARKKKSKLPNRQIDSDNKESRCLSIWRGIKKHEKGLVTKCVLDKCWQHKQNLFYQFSATPEEASLWSNTSRIDLSISFTYEFERKSDFTSLHRKARPLSSAWFIIDESKVSGFFAASLGISESKYVRCHISPQVTETGLIA